MTTALPLPRLPSPASAARLRLLAAALAGGTWLAMCAPASAAPPPSAGVSTEDREAQRTELYREAMKAATAGRWGEAKEKLRDVLSIRASPKVLFSLGQVEEQLGQLANAQADYARSRESAATEGKGDVVQAAEQAQRALTPRVPHLRVTLGGSDLRKPDLGANGASATLDDQPMALGTAVAVDPGEHRVTVRAPGMRSATLDVRIAEGQQLERSVSLVPEEAAPPSPPSSASSPRLTAPIAPLVTATSTPAAEADASANTGSTARTAGLVVAGVGVIALGIGAVFGVESIAKHNDAENACPSAACPTASGAVLWHDAVTAGNASTAAFIVGGAGLLAGGLLWLMAPKSPVPARVGFGPRSVQLQAAW